MLAAAAGPAGRDTAALRVLVGSGVQCAIFSGKSHTGFLPQEREDYRQVF
jgi:hypothetical protein